MVTTTPIIQEWKIEVGLQYRQRHELTMCGGTGRHLHLFFECFITTAFMLATAIVASFCRIWLREEDDSPDITLVCS